MSALNTPGLVLRHADYGDYDRMVTLFSPEYGRIDAVARGCRRPKSPLVNAVEPFVSGEFQLYFRKERFTIEQCVFNLTARLKKGPVLFTDMLSDAVTRDEIVSYFMAMLELLKLGRLHARQEHVFDDILILPGRRDEDGDGEPADEQPGEPADGGRRG